MVDPGDLKSIIMFGYLKDYMLEKIAGVTSITEYRAGNYIFKEGDYADKIYAIIEGEVMLELEKNVSTHILLDTMTRGRTIGFSALVDTEERKYTSSAKAHTDTKLYVWKGKDLEALFRQDYEMGFLFVKRIAKIIKTRLQTRNIQFLDIYR